MTAPVRLGLRENLAQFSLLVLINGFVGAMVGMERVVIPILAEEAYGLASYVAVLSFIITFGSAKALANLLAGRLGDQYGRKKAPDSGLDDWDPRTPHFNVGSLLGMDRFCQCFARDESRIFLDHDRRNEN